MTCGDISIFPIWPLVFLSPSPSPPTSILCPSPSPREPLRTRCFCSPWQLDVSVCHGDADTKTNSHNNTKLPAVTSLHSWQLLIQRLRVSLTWQPWWRFSDGAQGAVDVLKQHRVNQNRSLMRSAQGHSQSKCLIDRFYFVLLGTTQPWWGGRKMNLACGKIIQIKNPQNVFQNLLQLGFSAATAAGLFVSLPTFAKRETHFSWPVFFIIQLNLSRIRRRAALNINIQVLPKYFNWI